ncbi:putative 3-phosphoshikimate 1-carboxyvinyltransferase, partial [Ancylostoma ceylanicum]
PCSAETEEQVISICSQIAESGLADVLRAGIWKPRTRPDSFEGIGAEALPWLVEAGKRTGLPTTTEVANKTHVEQALKAGVDILWIGARTTVNPFAVQEIADALKGVDIPVMIKNPVNPDVDLWLGAFERLEKAGITDLVAIHRGFSVYKHEKYRNVPNWELPIALKERIPHLPMICDPSHITGKRELLLEVSQKAMDLNFDGLMIETHPNPDKAWSDASQQVTAEIDEVGTAVYEIKGLQTIRQTDYTVDGDWSSASYWLTASALGLDISVNGLSMSSRQADKAILNAFMTAGCRVMNTDRGVYIDGTKRKPLNFDATNCPDLFPALAVYAALTEGISVIKGVHRLANKESNRGEALKQEFEKLGVTIRIEDDTMLIEGRGRLRAATVFSHHDHRIAMCMAIAAIAGKVEVSIENAEATGKLSYADSVIDGVINRYNNREDNYAVGKFYNLKAAVAAYQHQQEQSVQYYQQAIAIFEKYQDQRQLAVIQFNLANIFFSRLDYPSVHKYITEAKANFEAIGDSVYMPVADGILAVSLTKLEEAEQSKSIAENALQASTKAKNPLGEIVAHYALGEYYHHKQQFDNALQHYKEAERLGQQFQVPTLNLPLKAAMLTAYNHLGSYQEAVAVGREALAIAGALNNVEIQYNLNKNLAEAFMHTGEEREAYQHLKTAEEIFRNNTLANNQKTLQKLLIEYETEKKNVRILQQDNAIAKQQTYIVLLATLTVLAVVIFINYRRNARQRRKIDQHNKALEITLALTQGEEKERVRLANELHDGIASNLIAIKLQLETSYDNNQKSEHISLVKKTHQEGKP